MDILSRIAGNYGNIGQDSAKMPYLQEMTEVLQDVYKRQVLAHEIGHYRKHHTVQFMLASILQTGIMLWLFSLLVNEPALSEALGGERVYFQLGLVAFVLLYTPVSMLIGLFMNAWSRKNEYEADAFAVGQGVAKDLISGLKKISVKALSNLTPHPCLLYTSVSRLYMYFIIISGC